MDEIVLGDVTITRVVEYFGSVEMSPDTFFPGSPEGATGVGNHKERPYSPVWSHLNTGFPGNLARAGQRHLPHAPARLRLLEPRGGHEPNLGRGNQNVFEDSVAPGHTPGSSVVTLESGTDRAAFAGDLLHTALQIVEPDTNSCFCENPAQARATRRRLLGWAAE